MTSQLIIPRERAYKIPASQIVGSRVVRGRDWNYGDQDGGNTGTVILDKEDGWVRVEWEHGSANSYQWGYENRFALDIIDSFDSKLSVTT